MEVKILDLVKFQKELENKMIKSIKFVILICFLTAIVPASILANINDGIVSAWTFDGNTKDSKGTSDGEINGGVEFTGGKFGKAANFNGKDGFISVPHKKAYEDLANGLTCSAWINIRNGKDHSAIAFKGTKVGWGANFLFRICTTNSTSMTWGVCVAGTEGWFATANVIQPNAWYFVCLTADGKQAIAHVASEKDGKVVIPPSGEGNPKGIAAPYLTFPDRPIEIGVGRAVGGTVGNDAYLDGIVDDIILWNRALTEDEIAELAKGKRPNVGFAVDSKDKLTSTWGNIKKR
jgi:hypothetical protein